MFETFHYIVIVSATERLADSQMSEWDRWLYTALRNVIRARGWLLLHLPHMEAWALERVSVWEQSTNTRLLSETLMDNTCL